MQTKSELQRILDDIVVSLKTEEILSNPESLSKIIISLALVNYEANRLMAIAELEEETSKQEFLNTVLGDGAKRMSSAEAETRAIVVTNNRYGEMKNLANSLPEIINVVKKRIETLSYEFKTS